MSARSWEPLDGEPTKAFDHFVRYRDLPPHERSLRRLAEVIVGEASVKGRRRSVSAAVRQMERYSTTYRWYERVQAWDRHCDAVRRREHERAIEQMSVRHAVAASRLLQAALSRLDDLDPRELRPADLARYLDVAVRVERLSRGADALPSADPAVEEDCPQDRVAALLTSSPGVAVAVANFALAQSKLKRAQEAAERERNDSLAGGRSRER